MSRYLLKMDSMKRPNYDKDPSKDTEVIYSSVKSDTLQMDLPTYAEACSLHNRSDDIYVVYDLESKVDGRSKQSWVRLLHTNSKQMLQNIPRNPRTCCKWTQKQCLSFSQFLAFSTIFLLLPMIVYYSWTTN